jgi:hypothetical protein
MVTYFNRKDLVSFGSYLMSEKRKARFDEAYEEAIQDGMDSPLPTEERLKYVYHADIENWIVDQKSW